MRPSVEVAAGGCSPRGARWMACASRLKASISVYLSLSVSVRSRIELMKIKMSDDDLNKAFVRFKELADKKKEISQADLEAIINDDATATDVSSQRFKLIGVQVTCGTQFPPFPALLSHVYTHSSI